MNWFPSPPPHWGGRNKNPNQLKRVQKRTQNFKSGDVNRKKEDRSRADIPSLPNHDKIRLDVIQSKDSKESSPTFSTTPTLIDFSAIITKMTTETAAQKDELEKEAALTGNLFPRICVDRGVLNSECSPEDPTNPHLNIDFTPASISVTRFFSENIRSVFIRDPKPSFGRKDIKVYANPIPFSFGGLKTNQIEKIVRNTHYNYKKLRQKAKAAEQDELARKAQNISISSGNSEMIPLKATPSISNAECNSESSSTSQILQGRETPSEMEMTFHANAVPSSARDEDDDMDLTEFDE
jgi:hypothetical protein